MNKLTPGPCKEIVHGPTPHGGIYMISYYFDSKFAPVVKESATRVIVHEYDEKNRSIHRDYINCGPNDEEEFAAMEAYEFADRPPAAPPKQQRPRNPRPPRRNDGPKPRTPNAQPENKAQQQPVQPQKPKQGKKPDSKKWAKPRPAGKAVEPEEWTGDKPVNAEKRRPPRRRKPKKPTPPTTE